MKLTTRAALAFTAMVAVLLPLSQPAAAAQPEVSTVSSLGEYYAAFKAGRAAKVVAYEPTYGALVGRGPNGEETHVLDVENWGTADRSRVQMYQYLQTGNYSNQRWHLAQFGDTTWNGHPVVALWDGNADNCLDESRDAPAKDGTAVYTYHCSFQPNQLWRLVPHPKYGGYYELRNHYDGRCLDIKDFAYNNGGGIQVWKCTSDWNEAWA